eukprot:12623773-Alexandrium_andersonii.AAC.1
MALPGNCHGLRCELKNNTLHKQRWLAKRTSEADTTANGLVCNASAGKHTAPPMGLPWEASLCMAQNGNSDGMRRKPGRHTVPLVGLPWEAKLGMAQAEN